MRGVSFGGGNSQGKESLYLHLVDSKGAWNVTCSGLVNVAVLLLLLSILTLETDISLQSQRRLPHWKGIVVIDLDVLHPIVTPTGLEVFGLVKLVTNNVVKRLVYG